MAQKNLKLGEILQQAGVIDEFQLNSALSHQRNWGGRLGRSLIQLGYVTEEVLLKSLSEQLNLPRVNLAEREIGADVLRLLPAEKAKQYHVMPVATKEAHNVTYLLVAMSDPTNLNLIDDLQFITGCRVKPGLASEGAIDKAIKRCYDHEVSSELEIPEIEGGVTLVMPEEDEEAQAVRFNEPQPVTNRAETVEERLQQLAKILLDKGIITMREYERIK